MILKTVKWLFLAIVSLVLLTVVILAVGSRMAMDSDYTHTKNSSELPVFSGQSMMQTENGLVSIAASGMTFRARVAGFESDGSISDKPAVILLHGFPVTSAMWIKLIEPLAEAGYRVVAFDQRGYSPGARPAGKEHYTTNQLSADVIAIADELGLEKFHLIGHDWGAAVGWNTVMQYPDRINSWSGLSIAHPAAFSEALQNDPDQQSRSSYFTLFVTPMLPEALFSFNDFTMLSGAYNGMLEEQKSEYIKVFSEPKALTSALNWYRSMTLSQEGAEIVDPLVAVPTLFLWGNNDPTVGALAVKSQAKYLTGPYQVIELDAGHWLLTDQPEAVIQAVLSHLETHSVVASELESEG